MNLYLVKNFNRDSSRRLLARAISHYSGGACFDIYEGKQGKPYARSRDKKRAEPHFSVSHTGSLWACVVGEQAVGMDIEDTAHKRGKMEEVALRFFTKQEQEYLSQEGMQNFFQVWVRKEAYIKYKGTGLSEGLRSFCVVASARRQTQDMDQRLRWEAAEELEDCVFQPTIIPSDKEEAYSAIVGVICSREPVYIERTIWLPFKEAKDAAAEYLQSRERCTKDLRRYLEQKKYPHQEVEEAMSFLLEHQYVDDSRYCRLYMEQAMRKGRGMDRIKRELWEKGLSTDTINQCYRELQREQEEAETVEQDETLLSDMDLSPEEKRAFEQALKIRRAQGDVPFSDGEKAKMARRLGYLGYGKSTIYRTLERIGRLK